MCVSCISADTGTCIVHVFMASADNIGGQNTRALSSTSDYDGGNRGISN